MKVKQTEKYHNKPKGGANVELCYFCGENKKGGKSRLQSLYIKQPGNFDKNTNDHYNEEATQSFMQSSGQNQYITVRSL